MTETAKIKKAIVKLLNELARQKFPQQHICKLLATDDVIDEISIFSNLEKSIPEVKSVGWTLVSALSYGPYLEKFAVSPDFIFESEFIGFALSHTDEPLSPTDEDKKLFSYKGKVHIITTPPFNDRSWAAYNRNGKEIRIESVD